MKTNLRAALFIAMAAFAVTPALADEAADKEAACKELLKPIDSGIIAKYSTMAPEDFTKSTDKRSEAWQNCLDGKEAEMNAALAEVRKVLGIE